MNKIEVEEPRITVAQANELQEPVGRMLKWLGEVKKGMEQANLIRSSTYPIVSKAHDAVYHLRVELHYESCLRGVGKASKD